MRGRLLGFDTRTGNGQISGDDGRRYPFATADWRPRTLPRSGQSVDFDVAGDRAIDIYSLGGGGLAVGDRNKIVAALLAFFLGVLGIHKFYLGRTTAGVIMLLGGTLGWLLILPGVVVAVIAFVECIIYLVTPDEEFERRYVDQQRAWF
ncbi:MAG TPA: TM2 domain-containing protein [Sphingomonas sp.]|nr:TM2 domain-containing protein [Sphingomonas sp.]